MTKRFVSNTTLGLLFTVSIFLSITLVGVPSARASTNPNALVRSQMYESYPTKFSAATYAQKVDMYEAHYGDAAKVQQIHALNPAAICLLYRSVREVYQSSDEFSMFKAKGWLLKDMNGNLIYSTDFPTNWLVDPGNLDYQQWLANWLKGYVDQYGFNGVFLDCSLYASIGEYCWSASSGPAMNPRTGQAFTDDQYKAAAIALINKVKNTIGSKIVICNGIYDGTRFFNGYHGDYTTVLLGSALDGVVSEGLFSQESSAAW
jgi:alpha-glucosidase (family GH31 glycosyl hydrolase)